jgi:hypothetical protein
MTSVARVLDDHLEVFRREVAQGRTVWGTEGVREELSTRWTK